MNRGVYCTDLDVHLINRGVYCNDNSESTLNETGNHWEHAFNELGCTCVNTRQICDIPSPLFHVT